MSTSTDGQICYGIPFENLDFPWEGKYEGDIEKWWQDVNGFKHSVEIYSDTDKSGYIDGQKPKQSVIDTYYKEEREWLKTNPLPVELVNYCSGGAPLYILAVPESFKSNSRGFPLEFNPAELQVTPEQRQNLIDFCEKYLGEKIAKHNDEEYNDVKITLEPKWYLTSYWG
jgi:hypothetical protein